MRHKTIINEANKIFISLQRLQERCRKLLTEAEKDISTYYTSYIEDVLEKVEDLSNFDMEDVLVHAYECQEIIEENKKNGIHVHILPRC